MVQSAVKSWNEKNGMSYTKRLRKLMTLDANMNASDIEKRFEQVAQMLFANFAIQKGGKIYLFKEIEFYFYNKNHRDLITYPRVSEPLCWYVNDFGGIDLNFASFVKSENRHSEGKNVTKYVLDDNACFGGILIRQLEAEENGALLKGPLACADLFRIYDAVAQKNQMPILVEHDHGMVGYICEERIHLLRSNQNPQSKVDSILVGFHEHPDKGELYKDFSAFIRKRYRFVQCDTLLHDEDTNVVFFSPWLKDKKEGHLNSATTRYRIAPKYFKVPE